MDINILTQIALIINIAILIAVIVKANQDNYFAESKTYSILFSTSLSIAILNTTV